MKMYEKLTPTERQILLDEHKDYDREEHDFKKNLTFSPYVSDVSKWMARDHRLKYPEEN